MICLVASPLISSASGLIVATMSRSPTQNNAPSPVYAVTFTGPNGEHAWWGCYFKELEEAERWAEWELERVADGQPGWIAEVDAGNWKANDLVISEPSRATVGPSTGGPLQTELDSTEG